MEQELGQDWILLTSKKDGDSRLCRSFREEPSLLRSACEDLAIYPYEGVLVARDTFDVYDVVAAHIVFGSSAAAPNLKLKLGLVAQ